MKVELWTLDRIKPYDKNPRRNDSAVAAVSRSIETYGFRQPIVVDTDGVIIVGHTRFKAAQKLGLAKVPVHVARDLSPEAIKAYRIADNKTGELAEWDFELLPIEISELGDAGFDLGLLGFDQDELTKLLSQDVNEGLTDPDDVPEPPDAAITQPGDLWMLGEHRLLCGDSSMPEDVDRLLDGQPIHLVNTDPPYNVRVEPRSNNAIAAGLSSFSNNVASKKLKSGQGNAAFDIARGKTKVGKEHHQKFDLARHPEKAKPTQKKMRAKDRPLANDFVSDEAFDQLLDAWFGNISRVLLPGRSFFIWGGYANLGNYPPHLKNHKLYFSQGIVWDKMHPVLTRKDFMGAFELCQPPDTKVLTPAGSTSIHALRDNDRVVSFSRHSSAIIGLREGMKIEAARRGYEGPLYGVAVGDKTTWCTDGHLWTAKFTPEAKSKWCVYLMRRGDWWRVGKSKLFSSWGFALKQRVFMEQAKAAWVLSTHSSNTEAMLAEQYISIHYGIPTTFWNDKQSSKRTASQIEKLYDQIDLHQLHHSATCCLRDHHLRVEYPLVSRFSMRPKYSERASAPIRACNLLAGVMAVPEPTEGQKFKWSPIRHLDVQQYCGPVYSLGVEKHLHYIADGIVTHNCFYGWKEGAGHKFFGPNNATDIWHVKKIPPQQLEHLTGKPAELAVRAMQYSSLSGENVLDLFGGSGSTLIAAQQTGRRAFLMELDPLYSDVIVDRFQRFSGVPAILERTGDSPISMKPREENMR